MSEIDIFCENRELDPSVIPLCCRSADAWLAAPRHTSGEEKKAKTELHKQMEQIDKGMKKLRRTLRKKESNAESLEWITKIEEAAIACKQMTPSRATTMPADQQPAFRRRLSQGNGPARRRNGKDGDGPPRWRQRQGPGGLQKAQGPSRTMATTSSCRTTRRTQPKRIRSKQPTPVFGTTKPAGFFPQVFYCGDQFGAFLTRRPSSLNACGPSEGD